MKTKALTTTLVLFLFVAITATAESKTKVIAVVNTADWCPTCEKNGPRAMAAFKANNTDGKIQFVMNNLTNDDTKKTSTKNLEKLGLKDAMSAHNGTGKVYFFDAKSKKLINDVSVAKNNEELAKTLASTLSKVK